jgi:hypothetical protein
MSSISTLSDLLKHSGAQFRILEMGRKIEKITKTQFEQIELNQAPYPFPLQNHAHFALVFWQKHQKQPYLWFLKLPLDERGLLNLGARNHFIAIIIEALGSDLTKDPSERQQEILKSNPYLFTPAQYKLAALNAFISKELKLPASKYYPAVVDYFNQKTELSNWQQLGAQGIADFVFRLNESSNSQNLQNCLHNLPKEVLLPLCTTLENVELAPELVDKIIALFHVSTDAEIKQQLLRALSSCYRNKNVIQLIDDLLSTSPDDSLLIVMASRAWFALEEQSRLMKFLHALVDNHQDLTLFNALFKDLVAIPSIRPILFQCMRAPDRSSALATAIGQLFNQTTNSSKV